MINKEMVKADRVEEEEEEMSLLERGRERDLGRTIHL